MHLLSLKIANRNRILQKLHSPVKVGQANGLGESLVHELLHGLPGLDVVTVHVGRVVALVSQREHGVLAVVGRVAAIGSQGWILT